MGSVVLQARVIPIVIVGLMIPLTACEVEDDSTPRISISPKKYKTKKPDSKVTIKPPAKIRKK